MSVIYITFMLVVVARVSFSFLPKGGRGGGHITLYGLLGGGAPVQNMWQTRGVLGYASLGNFDFGPFIGRNLLESGTVFAQT